MIRKFPSSLGRLAIELLGKNDLVTPTGLPFFDPKSVKFSVVDGVYFATRGQFTRQITEDTFFLGRVIYGKSVTDYQPTIEHLKMFQEIAKIPQLEIPSKEFLSLFDFRYFAGIASRAYFLILGYIVARYYRFSSCRIPILRYIGRILSYPLLEAEAIIWLMSRQPQDRETYLLNLKYIEGKYSEHKAAIFESRLQFVHQFSTPETRDFMFSNLRRLFPDPVSQIKLAVQTRNLTYLMQMEYKTEFRPYLDKVYYSIIMLSAANLSKDAIQNYVKKMKPGTKRYFIVRFILAVADKDWSMAISAYKSLKNRVTNSFISFSAAVLYSKIKKSRKSEMIIDEIIANYDQFFRSPLPTKFYVAKIVLLFDRRAYHQTIETINFWRVKITDDNIHKIFSLYLALSHLHLGNLENMVDIYKAIQHYKFSVEHQKTFVELRDRIKSMIGKELQYECRLCSCHFLHPYQHARGKKHQRRLSDPDKIEEGIHLVII